ncbi:TadE/TadG family type IV pilus assembly protein [Rhodospira trueperi]|uniref:TadE/TadG family type IV pilus assembly protein n=1 Tax=Rhodospira trueperi TaxID=69960 RepID=UPI0015A44128|nr:TadE/TadG family type IV pilus assembly protein [Rhodospira trueperi]
MAIEFAMVAMPVFMLSIAIIELGMMMVHSVTLSGALEEGARKLRTGEIFNASDPEQAFEDAVCGDSLYLVDCDDIVFDVRSYDDYDSVDLSPPSMGAGGMPSAPAFDPGDAGSVTVARVYMRFEFITPMIGSFFEDTHNSRMVQYTAIVKGEPWTNSGGGGS